VWLDERLWRLQRAAPLRRRRCTGAPISVRTCDCLVVATRRAHAKWIITRSESRKNLFREQMHLPSWHRRFRPPPVLATAFWLSEPVVPVAQAAGWRAVGRGRRRSRGAGLAVRRSAGGDPGAATALGKKTLENEILREAVEVGLPALAATPEVTSVTSCWPPLSSAWPGTAGADVRVGVGQRFGLHRTGSASLRRRLASDSIEHAGPFTAEQRYGRIVCNHQARLCRADAKARCGHGHWQTLRWPSSTTTSITRTAHFASARLGSSGALGCQQLK
jgi:hypothetical protein